MMMNLSMTLLLATAGGVLLGLFYFGGLRWTVRKGLASNSSALWFSLSFLLRSGACLAGFYLIGAGDAARMLACLGGFVIARFVVIRLTASPDGRGARALNDAGNAP
jgi:F1F0 ATPase subunit 2